MGTNMGFKAIVTIGEYGESEPTWAAASATSQDSQPPAGRPRVGGGVVGLYPHQCWCRARSSRFGRCWSRTLPGSLLMTTSSLPNARPPHARKNQNLGSCRPPKPGGLEPLEQLVGAFGV